MAKLIFKAPYYKPNSKTPSAKTRGGYLNYIATREGVEILPRSGMIGYVGERRGSNGLFSDEGELIIISRIQEEMDNHSGNIWGLIFSLKREDAERLGYNSAEQWMNLLRSHRNNIATNMHISPSNLRWFAAYHNQEDHPHVHMLVWSTIPNEPYLSTVGIENIKKDIAADIFRQENICTYQRQTEVREDLKKEFRIKIGKICDDLHEGSMEISSELVEKFLQLSEALSNHKGKKVYGYLDKNTKLLVNDIVKVLAEDEKISELYELWYKLQCETYRTYTDKMPDKIPIEENNEFKPIRNFVVKTASEFIPDMPVGKSFDVDYKIGKESEDNEEILRFQAEDDNIHSMYRLARLLLRNHGDKEEAEHWLKTAAEKGNVYAMYFLYQCYRDGRIEDKAREKLRYLLMAVDKEFAYAEYDYGKYLEGKNDVMALEYLRQAAKHGCVQAEYTIGKRLITKGHVEEGVQYLERAASKDNWSKFYLGLLYCYHLDEWQKGMDHLHSAADNGFEPAKNAIRNIQNGLNAKIITGICSLLYYASRIIDDRAEAEYPHPAFDAMESRAKKEDRAKRMGINYTGM